ncbi:MAG TPA: response regulator [Bryobacteraceae bacterium]|nr:response regulator [Bryobacteraceae bacterium]
MLHTFRTYNILVVEDNPGDIVLIREAFAECGKACALTFAETSQAAKEYLASQSFDLVISDMGIRKEEGTEFIRAIRSDERLKSLPIIVLSGSPDSKRAYDAGANAFIAKAMNMDEFFAKIKALMHFWVEVVELPRSLGQV